MGNRISEDLFQAIDVIVRQRIRAVEKDTTILCTVESNTYAAEGRYTVSNSAAKFEAFGTDTSYRVGQNVWVLVPDGDYNNDKLIIGKYAKEDTTPYIWVDPTHSYARVTENILTNLYDLDGLIANSSDPKDVFTGEDIEIINNSLSSSLLEYVNDANNWQTLPSNLGGYDRVCLSADFKTAFTYPAISGNYGIFFLIKTEITDDNNNTITKYIPVVLDSADMWGDPYNYSGYFTQSIVCEIDTALAGIPKAIVGCFYQMDNFVGENSAALPVQATPNLLVKNISMSFGYAIDQVQTDTLYLFTDDTTKYVVDGQPHTKNLFARFVYVNGLSKIAINNYNDLLLYTTGDQAIEELSELHPTLRWYRYNLKEGINDTRAGAFWEEIIDNVNNFQLTVNDLSRLDFEKFKCILCYNTDVNANPETDQLIISKELIFTNSDNAWDETSDYIQGLRLEPADRSNGVFNLYAATLGTDSMLINSADEFKTRIMQASFWSAVAQDDELDTVQRLTWYIPKHSTMIKAPQQDKLQDGQTLVTSSNINSASLGLSTAEKALINERDADYYAIIDTIVTEHDETTTATLRYWIKKKLIKHYTHNTIRVSAYRHGRIYEGTYAKYELKFGSKGTNGTGYTLLLNMTDEIAVDSNTSQSYTYSYPSAWTWAEAPTTSSIGLEAILLDADEQLVPANECTYAWSVVYPTGSRTNITNAQTTTPRVSNIDEHGIILKCVVTLAGASKTFTGYLIIPTRTSRNLLAMNGPTMIRYDSAGTNPQFDDIALGIFDIEENIDYYNSDNKNIQLCTLEAENAVGFNLSDLPSSEAWRANYYPSLIKNTADDKYHLKTKAMFFDDVDYNLYVKFNNSNNTVWSNPILVLIDPYGNKFLNNWGGDLTIDYENDTIMSAVMGAGKKEIDNTFTGLLIGDLPRVDDTDLTDVQRANRNNWHDRTGIVGYEHGEQYYQLFDNGTITLGKPSQAQLKFNGSESTIQNGGYETSGTGIKIDFDGNSQNQRPYIDILGVNGAKIHLGTSTEDPYLQVRGTTSGQDLIHIANQDYYLQTNSYTETTSGVLVNDAYTSSASTRLEVFDATTGPITYATDGLKINLGTGDIKASDFELLATKNGNHNNGFLRMSAKANAYPINVNNKFLVNWDGSITAKEFNLQGTDTTSTTPSIITISGIHPQWMTFVTDISGTITKSQVDVSVPVNVSTSTTVAVSYPVYTTTSKNMTVYNLSSDAIFNRGIQNNTGISESITYVGDDATGLYGQWPEGTYEHNIYIPKIEYSGYTTTYKSATAYINDTFYGSTTYPVVVSVNLTVSKISMWALTNSSATTTTVTIQ